MNWTMFRSDTWTCHAVHNSRDQPHLQNLLNTAQSFVIRSNHAVDFQLMPISLMKLGFGTRQAISIICAYKVQLCKENDVNVYRSCDE